MTHDQTLASGDEIASEALTDEMIAAYQVQGFTLICAEDVLRFDLSHEVPQTMSVPSIAFLAWNAMAAPVFFGLYEAAFRERPGFPGWSEDEWVRWVSDDPTFRPDLSYLATIDEQPVGFITNAEDEQSAGRDGYIIQVGVAPSWRTQGIRAALVDQSLRAWRTVGKEAVTLHVNVNNPVARDLYLRLGFDVVGRRGRLRKSSPS